MCWCAGALLVGQTVHSECVAVCMCVCWSAGAWHCCIIIKFFCACLSLFCLNCLYVFYLNFLWVGGYYLEPTLSHICVTYILMSSNQNHLLVFQNKVVFIFICYLL